jgi:hypothetical protein
MILNSPFQEDLQEIVVGCLRDERFSQYDLSSELVQGKKSLLFDET